MRDTLQTFAEFEQSLNLRTQFITGMQLIHILDLLTDRLSLKKAECHSGLYIYEETPFGIDGECIYHYRYDVAEITNHRITFKFISNLFSSNGFKTEDPNLHELFLLIENSFAQFLGFSETLNFTLDREIKAVSEPVKASLQIATDYEFLDVLAEKHRLLNNEIARL
jgi:hypothetical protein